VFQCGQSIASVPEVRNLNDDSIMFDGKLAAIVFDFDGVIVESAEIKTEAFRRLFAHRPEYLDDIVALHERYVGLDRFSKFAMIYRDVLHQPLAVDEMERLGRRFKSIVEESVTQCEMVKGAQDTLDRFAGRIPLAIVSGTPQGELDAITERRKLRRYFTAMLGSPPGKPDLISRLLGKYHWRPQHVVMVGDGLTDLEAAQANAIGFIGRVRAERNPFPQGTSVIADLTHLPGAIAALLGGAAEAKLAVP